MKIRLHVGVLGDSIQLPSAWPRLGGRSVVDYFAAASRTADGSPAIELEIQQPRNLDKNLLTGGVAASDSLNQALADLTGNEWQDKPVRDIGIIFTTRGHVAELDPGAFGVMFDQGFSAAWAKAPREGCAVFMETMAAERTDPGDFQEEALFTAMHELGHVFNLWHLNRPSDPPSFMRSSANSAHPLGAVAWRFANGSPPRSHQCYYLSQCGAIDEVTPGGEAYGERGSYGPTENDAQNAPTSRGALRLHIDLRPRRFWWFEPVELEIQLSCDSSRKRGIRLPNEVDPGYRSFEIWIEEPDGTRKRYRAPRRYCAAAKPLVIAPGRPFQRDLSIFGEAGGFTFRRPGPHILQAFLRLPSGSVVASNRLVVELAEVEASRFFQRARNFFTDERVTRLMFYRTMRRSGQWLDDVHTFAKSHARSWWAPAIYYALGRAYVAQARTLNNVGARRSREGQALAHLSRALEHEEVTPNRKRVAKRILSELC